MWLHGNDVGVINMLVKIGEMSCLVRSNWNLNCKIWTAGFDAIIDFVTDAFAPEHDYDDCAPELEEPADDEDEDEMSVSGEQHDLDQKLKTHKMVTSKCVEDHCDIV